MANKAPIQSSIPTIAERVKETQPLVPTIRSYSISEYDRAHVPFINPDRNAGSGWYALGKALDGWNVSLGAYAKQQRDKEMEKAIAEGTVTMDKAIELEGVLANKMSWKKLIEKHPELANANPWAEWGYEQARLQKLGMELSDGLQTFIEDSGIYNLDNPEEAQAAINEYIKKFRQEANIEGFHALLAAKSYSPVEAQIRQQAFDGYQRHRFDMRQDKLADATHDLMITGLSDKKRSAEDISDFLTQTVEQAELNGLLHKNTEALIVQALKAAYTMRGDRALLDAVEKIKIGDRELIKFNGVAEWVEKQKEINMRKDAAASAKAASDMQRFMTRQAEQIGCEIASKWSGNVTWEEALNQWQQEHPNVKLSEFQKYQIQAKAITIKHAQASARSIDEGDPNYQNTRLNIFQGLKNAGLSNEELVMQFQDLYAKTKDNFWIQKASALVEKGFQEETAEEKMRASQEQKTLRDLDNKILKPWLSNAITNGKKNVIGAVGGINYVFQTKEFEHDFMERGRNIYDKLLNDEMKKIRNAGDTTLVDNDGALTPQGMIEAYQNAISAFENDPRATRELRDYLPTKEDLKARMAGPTPEDANINFAESIAFSDFKEHWDSTRNKGQGMYPSADDMSTYFDMRSMMADGITEPSQITNAAQLRKYATGGDIKRVNFTQNGVPYFSYTFFNSKTSNEDQAERTLGNIQAWDDSFTGFSKTMGIAAAGKALYTDLGKINGLTDFYTYGTLTDPKKFPEVEAFRKATGIEPQLGTTNTPQQIFAAFFNVQSATVDPMKLLEAKENFAYAFAAHMRKDHGGVLFPQQTRTGNKTQRR